MTKQIVHSIAKRDRARSRRRARHVGTEGSARGWIFDQSARTAGHRCTINNLHTGKLCTGKQLPSTWISPHALADSRSELSPLVSLGVTSASPARCRRPACSPSAHGGSPHETAARLTRHRARPSGVAVSSAINRGVTVSRMYTETTDVNTEKSEGGACPSVLRYAGTVEGVLAWGREWV